MKRKKGLKRILTLFLSLLVIMNSVLTPARIYAEEEETEATIATEEITEVVKEEDPDELKEELKFGAAAEKEMVPEQKAIQAETKMEVLVEQPAVLEEKKELATEKLELKEEIKEAVKEVEEIDETVEEVEEVVDEGRVPDDQPIKLTIHYCGIIQTNGVEKEMQDSNTLSPGVGWNITLKKFMNKIPKEKFSNKGITYEFVNWIDANGNPVTGTLKFKREDFDRDTDLYFYAVYNITEPTILKFRYIDNVSTGSGSWSNSQGTFDGYSHTFKQPDDQPHYQFLYWLDQDNVRYGAGDTKVVAKTDIESGKTTEMNVYAIWQPSVTVNYYDDEGKLINSVEKFSDYDVYSYSAENRDEETFLGWSETKGGSVAQALTYSAPAASSSKTSPAVYSVYGVWATDYRIEHYIEELDGSFSLKESETVKNAIVNTEAEAENKEYTGFTYDATIEGSKSAGTVKGGLVLKFYYTRNSYTVTYAYENAPANASALPEEETYKFEADVKVADPATAEGYTFSGWDKNEDFQMPAENVTITGSWQISRYTVTWIDEDGTILELDEEVEHGSMPSYDGEEPVKEADSNYTYSFEGWTPEVSEVTGDITYQASYKKEKITVIPQTPEEPEPKTPSTVDPEPTVEEAQIDETPIPLAEPEEVIEIEETEVPMAEAEIGSWALINLIASILSVLTALGMIITFFTGKEKEEEDENEKDEDEEESQNRKESKFLGLIPAILSVIVFIRTEDMRLPMVYTDRYTLLMVIILVVSLLLAIVTRNRKKEKEESYGQELAADQA